ncbi:hypothetical protein HOY80DRAFT_986746 [Tuber brumale]|nr:hypothetical protein HOY80DRAFT_986746 [Tuber brumale]
MEEVMPDLTDRHWITPLACACQIGDKESVEMLPEWGDVNPDLVGHRWTTPLAWAAMNGHEKIVSMLLRTGVVDLGRWMLWVAWRFIGRGTMRISVW